MDERRDADIPLETRPIHLRPGVAETMPRLDLPLALWANTRIATDADVAGGESYGIRTVWLSGSAYRSEDDSGVPATPTYTILTMDELPELLCRITEERLPGSEDQSQANMKNMKDMEKTSSGFFMFFMPFRAFMSFFRAIYAQPDVVPQFGHL